MPDANVNRTKIHYEERGAGEPLVLIMGLGADGSLWEDHAKVYEKHFRCILIDNRGAGGSDKPNGPYTTKMMADDTAGLMDALSIRKARIAGISMGGAIAQQVALNHPEKVQSLVLISTWAKCDTYAVTIFEHFKKIRAAVDPAHFMQLLQLWIFTAPHVEQHIDELRQGQKDAGANPMPQHAFEAQCDACISHDTLDRLGQIKAPTLITVGDADIFTPMRFSQVIHKRISGSEMTVFPGCGHAHHWEDLERFNSKTLDFLKKH